MGHKAARCGFDGKASWPPPGVGVGLARAGGLAVCETQDEHGCPARPGLVERHQANEHAREFGRIVAAGHEKAPRLLVIGRGRPAPRLKQGAQDRRLDRPIAEGAGAPAAGEQVVDREIGGGGDTLAGGAEEDSLFGGDTDDVLHGNSSNDHLFGDAGSDALLGDDGRDLLDGSTGNDSAESGAGNDMYLFREGSGDNTFVGGSGFGSLHLAG
jgi:hypothetical protein